jgi:hypothetical protein
MPATTPRLSLIFSENHAIVELTMIGEELLRK